MNCSPATSEDDMLRRDFLKTTVATAALAAVLPLQAKEARPSPKGNFADVNGQHLFYSAQGAGKPLVLLHGGIDPDSYGSNVAELAKTRKVIAVHLQAHGRTPDTDRPLRSETMGDDIAALIGQLNLGKADVMGFSLGAGVAMQTAIRHPEVVDRLVVVSATMKQDGFYPEGGLQTTGGQRCHVGPKRQGVPVGEGLS
jgi:pimeloyl-ACP methyl ester carboxylesterase